ncbi:Protein NEDD1 [Symbiodinium microadriaticum]|uniref:Protein NEDD1 n=1 Tax=Symbiodinium microadriaticum TaxID=2951 RepID=A0A1Q9D217_SYMMI|nr:Protein NEDD1 [Symbiodinium microadriaticum]
MLASASRGSLVVLECDGSDGSSSPQVGDEPTGPIVHSELALEGVAKGLAWDTVGKRVVVAVAGAERGAGTEADRLCLCETLGDESLVEYVSLPAGAEATGLSFYAEEKRKAWVAVSCTDGAVRLIDASPERTASVVRSCYFHGVAATAVAISHGAPQIASGSSSGHVVLQPFHGTQGPTPLPGLLDAESPIESLCYSSLRQELLAASDSSGSLQIWDATALRHVCRFAGAHRGPARGLSFSTQNSDLLISGGRDAALVFWDVRNSRQIQEVSVEAGITSLSYHSGGYLLATGTCDGTILIFDLRMLVSKKQPADPVQRYESQDKGALAALAFAPDASEGGSVTLRPKVVASAASPAISGASQTALRASADEFHEDNVAQSFASIDSLMDRLSKRATAKPDAERTSSTPLPGVTVQVEAKGIVPPLPSTGSRNSSGTVSKEETPLESRRSSQQVSRYSIGSPGEDAAAAPSPWWKGAEAKTTPTRSIPQALSASSPPAALAEALRPLLAELKKDFSRQVQEVKIRLAPKESVVCDQNQKKIACCSSLVHIVVDASWKKYIVVISVSGLARETTGGGPLYL